MFARLRKLFDGYAARQRLREIEFESPEWDLEMRALCAQIALRNGMNADMVTETYGEDAASQAAQPRTLHLQTLRRRRSAR